MNFGYNDKTNDLLAQIKAFMNEHIYPIEEEIYNHHRDPEKLWQPPPQVEVLKKKARDASLWNFFLPEEYAPYSPGLSNLEYAPLAEEMGRINWASEVFNCSAPDTGNMEVLAALR